MMFHSPTKAAQLLLKCISFFLVFLILLCVMSPFFIPKNNDENSGIKSYWSRGFYGEPKNSLEVISIGNSNMFSGFSPMELWKLYGYTGYNCGESGQTIFEAYNILSEVLTCQKPNVVVLDADGIFPTGGHMDTYYQFLDFNLDRIFPMMYYHSRWKTIQLNETMHASKYTWTCPTRGYLYNDRVKPFSGHRPKMNNPAADRFSAVTKFQLETFQNLCKNRNVRLVLVYIPTAYSWDQTRHDLMAEYASAHNIPFIDLNTSTDGFQIDWEKDTLDGGTHLNYFGAKRVTQFIGAYMHQHYYLSDYRKNTNFLRWNMDYEKYINEVKQ